MKQISGEGEMRSASGDGAHAQVIPLPDGGFVNLTQHLDGDLQSALPVPDPHQRLTFLPHTTDKMSQFQFQGFALGKDRRLQ